MEKGMANLLAVFLRKNQSGLPKRKTMMVEYPL